MQQEGEIFYEFIKHVYLEYMQARSHLRSFIVFGGGRGDNQMSITESECVDTSYIVLDWYHCRVLLNTVMKIIR